MSEKAEGSAPEGIDPFAASLALSGASREKADAYLDDQRHHIHEQLKQIHLDIFEKWLGVLLRMATLCVGIAAASGVGLMVWDAAHSNGLLIEPFAVPPDMAAKGITGQVVASQVLDQLTTMDASSASFRPPLSYANNWGKDIKVEIPETGVSIGEFRRFLREWLGNDTHISGEVWHTDTGIAISARTGGERGATFTGPQSDFDALVQKAAEHVYQQTQPYRYAGYARGQRRFDEARAIYLRLTESSSHLEQGWAWQGIATIPPVAGSPDQNTVWAMRKAIAVYPDYTQAYVSLAGAEYNMGHAEAALADVRTAVHLLDRNPIPDVDSAFTGLVKKAWAWRLPNALGDYSEVIALTTIGMALPDQAAQREVMRQGFILARALRHETKAALELKRQVPPPSASLSTAARRAILDMRVEAASENWENVLALAPEIDQKIQAVEKRPNSGAQLDLADTRHVTVYPMLALAKAKLGDIAGAQAMIGATPEDCYDCIRVRGLIAAQAKDWNRADSWFAKAVHDGPSIPFAYCDWGQALLARGQPDAAIAQFKLSSQKGPHFADPLEGWGEALMAKNQSHLALAKFAQANQFAPNWGRLHLKWGEALAYASKKDEAAKQFARAAQLDLTPSEKSELATRQH